MGNQMPIFPSNTDPATKSGLADSLDVRTRELELRSASAVYRTSKGKASSQTSSLSGYHSKIQ